MTTVQYPRSPVASGSRAANSPLDLVDWMLEKDKPLTSEVGERIELLDARSRPQARRTCDRFDGE